MRNFIALKRQHGKSLNERTRAAQPAHCPTFAGQPRPPEFASEVPRPSNGTMRYLAHNF